MFKKNGPTSTKKKEDEEKGTFEGTFVSECAGNSSRNGRDDEEGRSCGGNKCSLEERVVKKCPEGEGNPCYFIAGAHGIRGKVSCKENAESDIQWRGEGGDF